MLRPQLALGALALLVWCGSASAADAPVADVAEPDAPAGAQSPETPAPDDYDPLFDDEEWSEDLEDGAEADPLESMNRGVFAFNQFVDTWVFDPVTEAYQFLFPEMVRTGINNVFLNLQSPVVLLNHIMQLRGRDAMVTLGRFVVNSTAGGGGFFDAAGGGANLTRVDADFGQTLAIWGAPQGPYLILPVLGPSTVRDVTGVVVDRGLDPLTYLIGPIQWWIPIGLSKGLALRDASFQDLTLLRESSVDFYSALRSAYLQSREASVQNARSRGETPPETASEP